MLLFDVDAACCYADVAFNTSRYQRVVAERGYMPRIVGYLP